MPLNRTLGELRADLSARLGYGASGANIGPLVPVLNSYLASAQATLYWDYDWRSLRTHVIDSLGAGAFYLDVPATIHEERLEWISVRYSNVWTPPLKVGISAEMYTSQTIAQCPTHWDFNRASGSPQIEFWPEPDAAYSVRLFGIAPLSAFTADAHRSTIDSELVFLYALAHAKAHYKQEDTALVMEQLNKQLAQVKNKGWVKRVYERGDESGWIYPRPLVVGRDV